MQKLYALTALSALLVATQGTDRNSFSNQALAYGAGANGGYETGNATVNTDTGTATNEETEDYSDTDDD